MSTKILAQVNKLVADLEIADSSDRSIDILIDNLILQNRDYERKPKALFRKTVTDALSKYFDHEENGQNISNSSHSSMQQIKSGSLNSSLLQLYKTNGSTSRRVGIVQDSYESLSIVPPTVEPQEISSPPVSVPPTTGPTLSKLTWEFGSRIGSGWVLVRHLAKGYNWHAATDGLKGTSVYGTYEHDTNGPDAFSIDFRAIPFDEFLFSTADMKKWLIADKSSVLNSSPSGGSSRSISASSISDQPYSVNWCNEGEPEHPVISLIDWESAISTGDILYIGNNNSTLSKREHSFSNHTGVNVFIRPTGDVLPTAIKKHFEATNRKRSLSSTAAAPSKGRGVTSTSRSENPRKKLALESQTVPAAENQMLVGGPDTASLYLKPRPINRLQHLAGIDTVLSIVRETVFYPAWYPTLYEHIRIHPPTGLLLHGPSGCGKTSLALAIAGELGYPFFKVSGPELIGGTSGESESRIRDLFTAAIEASPSVLFIDSVDVIAGKRDSSQRGMDRRVIAQLLDGIDMIMNRDLGQEDGADSAENIATGASAEAGGTGQAGGSVGKTGVRVVLISATNRPDQLDPSVRGRFDRELSLPVPDAAARGKILQLVCGDMLLGGDVDFGELGKMTPGFVGADLKALVREAGVTAVRRIVATTPLAEVVSVNVSGDGLSDSDQMRSEEVKSAVMEADTEVNTEDWLQFDPSTLSCESDKLSDRPLGGASESDHPLPPLKALRQQCVVSMVDLCLAAKSVQPSATREGFAVVPDVTWADVGALAEVREELLTNVLEPISHPERYQSLGLEVPAGVLFFGPPGCGKTLLAKAVANQSGANFISVKGPELLNMFVGESESRVRQVFTRARASAPCVIFFDELDALCPRRSSAGESSNGVSERVVNQMLTELDGLESRKDVYVIAATNRLELIDEAMLRPGRIGKLLYVPLPTPADRTAILTALTRKLAIQAGDEELIRVLGLDPRTEGFSGADLSALVREAGMAVVREWRSDGVDKASDDKESPRSVISSRHFEQAFQRVKPSVSAADRKRYACVQEFMKQGVGALQALHMVNALDFSSDGSHKSS